jgi:diguanylate cyclase (GGDEF)-like protein
MIPGAKTLTFDPAEVETSREAGRVQRRESPRINAIRVIAGHESVLFSTVTPGMSILVGRSDCDLQLPDGMTSREHARVECDAQGQVTVVDLDSANGTWVNKMRLPPHHPCPLMKADHIRFGRTLTRFEQLTREEYDHLLRVAKRVEDSRRDSLTGLLTRRYIDEDLDKVLREHDEVYSPVSAVFIDVDHFKRVNDTVGHAVGDQVLAEVARILMEHVRAGDPAVRYGGEEMAVILPGCAEIHGHSLAERIRKAIAWNDWAKHGCKAPVTVSLGVAERVCNEDKTAWLHRADQSMYRAKHSGRNRTVAWSAMATIRPDD